LRGIFVEMVMNEKAAEFVGSALADGMNVEDIVAALMEKFGIDSDTAYVIIERVTAALEKAEDKTVEGA
jgi:hypothetical protein